MKKIFTLVFALLIFSLSWAQTSFTDNGSTITLTQGATSISLPKTGMRLTPSGTSLRIEYATSASAYIINYTTVVPPVASAEALRVLIDAMLNTGPLIGGATEATLLQVESNTDGIETALGTAASAAGAADVIGQLKDIADEDFATEATQLLQATAAKQDILLTELQLKADLTETQPVSAASLPLPSGASTSALQTTGNTALLAIQSAVETLDNTVAGNELQVDVLTMPPISAGSNLIGEVILTDGFGDDASISPAGELLVIVPNVVNVADNGTTLTVDAFSTFPTDQINATEADYDSGAGTSNQVMFGVALPGSGGAVAGGTSANPISITGTITATPAGTQDVNVTQVSGNAVATGNGIATTGTPRVAIVSDNTAFSVNANAGTNLNTSALSLEATQSSVLTELQQKTEPANTQIVGDAGAIINLDANGDVQVDVLSMPTTTVTATDLDIRNLDDATDTVNVKIFQTGTANNVDANITNATLAATQSGTWNIGTVTTVSGATISNGAGASAVNIQDGGNSITIDGTITATPTGTQDVNLTQVNGVTFLTGNGITGTGSPRVTIASDNTAFTVNAAQSGAWNITNISGTVSLPTGAATLSEQQTQTTALQLIDNLPLSQGSTTLGQSGALVQAAVTTAAPSYTTAQTSPLSLQTDGSLRAAITNTPTVTANAGTGTFAISAASLPLPTGAATETTLGSIKTSVEVIDNTVNGSNQLDVKLADLNGAATAANQTTEITALQIIDNLPVAQGSTTSGQSGALAQGAVTTSAPTYTTAQTSPFSLQTDGSLRTAITNTPTVTANAGSGTFTVGDGGGAITVDNAGTFAVQAAQSGTWTMQPGNTANTTAWLMKLSQTTTDNDVDIASALPAGTANIGDVDVLTLPALVAGTANIGDVDVLTLPNVTLAAGTNTNEVVGDAASGTAKAGNPVQIGGVFNTTQPTVTTGQVVELQTTARGAAIVATGVDAFATNATLSAETTKIIGTVNVAAGQTIAVTNAGTFATQATLQAGTAEIGKLAAGLANIGDVDVASIAAGDNNIGNVDIASAIPAGTNNIGDVDIASFVAGGVTITGRDLAANDPLNVAIVDGAGGQITSFGGTEYTVNAVAPADPVGTTFVMERDDILSALAEIEGDWTQPRASANGALWTAIDAFPDNEPFNIAQINGVTPLMGNGVTGTGSLRVTIASDNTAFTVNTGTFPDNEPFNIAQIGGTATVTAGVSGLLAIGGNVASDAVDSGNPVKIGGMAVALSANPTKVAAADRTDFIANQYGVQYVMPGHPNIQSATTIITGAVTNSVLVSVAAGTRIVIVAYEIMAPAIGTAGDVFIGTTSSGTTPTSNNFFGIQDINAGNMITQGYGNLWQGADGDDLLLTAQDIVTGEISVIIRYFIE